MEKDPALQPGAEHAEASQHLKEGCEHATHRLTALRCRALVTVVAELDLAERLRGGLPEARGDDSTHYQFSMVHSSHSSQRTPNQWPAVQLDAQVQFSHY